MGAKPKDPAISCTSQPCSWIIPGRQIKPTGPVSTLPQNVQTARDRIGKRRSFYDPQHSDDIQVDVRYTLQQLRDLKNLFLRNGNACVVMVIKGGGGDGFN